MAILNFWKRSREDVLRLTVEQVVTNAGDGNLRDASATCDELREFLGLVPCEQLFAYAQHCMDTSFNKSGFVLQDIVNELGRRLDFDVENGPYRGRSGVVGFDGIWRWKEDPEIVIEVKTTDTYAVSLDTFGNYRDRLISENRLGRNASILVVVGREDTGSLEAQVRGSRYAWDMRLISVDRLTRIVQVKEKADDPDTLSQIRQLLRPFEYTKIDRIIDVVFTTTVDVESQEESADDVSRDGGEEAEAHQVRTDPELLNAKRQRAADAFARSKGKELVRRSRTLFWSPDKELRVCCVVSKRYERSHQPYWYAYHPKWDSFLAEGKESYFVLACMDRDEAYALPYSWIAANKQNLNVTEREQRSYWHIAVTNLEGGGLAINLSKVGNKVALEPFIFGIVP